MQTGSPKHSPRAPVCGSISGMACCVPGKVTGPNTRRAPSPWYQPIRNTSISKLGAAVLTNRWMTSPRFTLVADA